MNKIQIFETFEDLTQSAADLFIKTGNEAIKTKNKFSVALSGGSTPLPLYKLLVDQMSKTFEWDKTHFFWGDERCVPPDHQDSNFRQANSSLLMPLEIPNQNIYRVKAELPPDEAARLYQDQIQSFFEGNRPEIDLILLGMGSDGHTASLFPNTDLVSGNPSLEERLVVENWVPQLDTWRISFSPSLINAGKNILFMVSGQKKASPLKKVLEGNPDPINFPSQLINPAVGNLYWFIDREAGTQLTHQDSD